MVKTITFGFGRFIRYNTVGFTSKSRLHRKIQVDVGIIVLIPIAYPLSATLNSLCRPHVLILLCFY